MFKILRPVLALACGLVLAVALTEFLLAHSSLIDNPPGQFRRSASRMFEHSPNFTGRDTMGHAITINSHGMRDREFPVEKPAGVYRVLVLGDSVAFGDRVSAEETFSKQLEQLLNAASLKAEVLNTGIRGYNTYQELQLLKETGFLFHPDLVILLYVTNDAEPLSNQAGIIDRKHAWLIEAKDFLKMHSYLYAFFRKNLEVLRRTTTPEKFAETYDDQYSPDNPGWRVSRDSMSEMKRLSEEKGAALLLAVYPRLQWSGGRYPSKLLAIHEQILAAGKEMGIPTVDLLAGLMKEEPDAERLKISAGDDFHPNPAGHRLIAKILAEQVLHTAVRS